MASASQLPEPRHGAEGGAWGRDKLFLPWSPLRRGDRTGLEPQLSIADNIHRSVRGCMCVIGWIGVQKETLGLGDVSVCVPGVGWGGVGSVHRGCIHLHVCPNSQIAQLRQKCLSLKYLNVAVQFDAKCSE